MDERREDGYAITDDPARVDRDLVYGWIGRESYWATGIPRERFERGLDNSLCFSLFAPGGSQTGFARAVTDRATFAYIGDVWIDAAHRGKGLGGWLVAWLLAHPDLQGLRTKVLLTADAHSIYEPFGFERPAGDVLDKLMIDFHPAREVYGS